VRRLGRIACLALLLPGAAAAAVNAEKLHATRCSACHNDSIYTRPDRKVGSLEALTAQISACGHGSGQPLGAEERDAMIRYLNDRYYRFK
jgi:hypothetical protein